MKREVVRVGEPDVWGNGGRNSRRAMTSGEETPLEARLVSGIMRGEDLDAAQFRTIA